MSVCLYMCGIASQLTLAHARLSRGKERVWSNSVLCFMLSTPRNPWPVNWLSTASDVLWLLAEGARESSVRETIQQQPKLSTWPA